MAAWLTFSYTVKFLFSFYSFFFFVDYRKSLGVLSAGLCDKAEKKNQQKKNRMWFEVEGYVRVEYAK